MKSIDIKNLKGTQDFLPEQQAVRNTIIDILKRRFVLYGYQPIETPILNSFDLLKYKYEDGDEILGEIYRLSDQGERDLGLRYDLTIPFCKVISINQNLTIPFRRYEIGRVFRDGPIKKGRMREFYQCDVDVVGIDGRMIELEQMQMVVDVFNDLGIDIIIKWNNRKLMYGLLISLGYQKSQLDEIISLIDRLEKISLDELCFEFSKININKDSTLKILDLFSKSLSEYSSLFNESQISELKDGLSECVELDNLIMLAKLNKNCIFSPTLARGLGIYTGTVFEFFDREKRIVSSLGGGGRYDKIITDFISNGENYPAVGLSFGLEPIYCLLESTLKQNFIDVLIAPMGTEINCLEIANILRNNDIKTIIDLSGKKVKKMFDFANKINAKYVIVVGENEINSNLFALKNMQSGEQISLTIENIVKLLKQKN